MLVTEVRCCFFNSSKFLEIAINRADKNAKGGASTLLGIKEGDQIYINFQSN